MAREAQLIATLVELADNLVDDYDVIDVLTVLCDRCVETIDVDAAGVMLASPGGELQFVASSSESMRVLELFQVQADEGPCVDCYRSGEAIVNYNLNADDDRWPNFTPRALEQGFLSVHSLPMRLRGRTIGALNLFRTHQGPMGVEDVAAAQGLADVATIAILQHQSSLNASALNEQLSNALNSRIIIEQAKGMISQATNCDMDQAFGRLRAHARNHNEGLTGVATRVVEGNLDTNELDFPIKSVPKK
jgi:GAF domain-containing protein